MDAPRLNDLERVLLDRGARSERWEWRIKETIILHHPHEPAVRYNDGDWVWHWMDEFHRWDGPSSLIDGEYRYYIYGERLTRAQWERDPQRLEWLMEQAKNI